MWGYSRMPRLPLAPMPKQGRAAVTRSGSEEEAFSARIAWRRWSVRIVDANALNMNLGREGHEADDHRREQHEKHRRHSAGLNAEQRRAGHPSAVASRVNRTADGGEDAHHSAGHVHAARDHLTRRNSNRDDRDCDHQCQHHPASVSTSEHGIPSGIGELGHHIASCVPTSSRESAPLRDQTTLSGLSAARYSGLNSSDTELMQ
jgi:hypothetical protein